MEKLREFSRDANFFKIKVREPTHFALSMQQASAMPLANRGDRHANEFRQHRRCVESLDAVTGVDQAYARPEFGFSQELDLSIGYEFARAFVKRFVCGYALG